MQESTLSNPEGNNVSCLICGDPTIPDGAPRGGAIVYDCRRCGPWALDYISAAITDGLKRKLGNGDRASRRLRSRLSHIVRQQQRPGAGWVQVSANDLERWRLDVSLPTPAEQLDRLVLLVGDEQPSPSDSADMDPLAIVATVGTTIDPPANGGFDWLITRTETQSLIEIVYEEDTSISLRLTLVGWDRYQEIKKGHVASRRVLMAMKFGDPELDGVVQTCFRPAVTRAGFELRLLSDGQPAGLIDDQLRVALRTSRFIVADLTHDNSGAYWESGFIEGLGRPVIYTCRADKWEERKTHFDTNHLVTVVWSAEKLDQAGGQLTATIRATLPEEANMTD